MLIKDVWLRTEAYLRVARAETGVAEQFNLQRTQARAWLQRALDERLAAREGRGRRYVVADSSQPELYLARARQRLD